MNKYNYLINPLRLLPAFKNFYFKFWEELNPRQKSLFEGYRQVTSVEEPKVTKIEEGEWNIKYRRD